MFAQHVLLIVNQHVVQARQASKQLRVAVMGDGKPPKREVVAEPELVLQIREPRRIDV
ncbi:hypothetical protein D3C86_2262270 [compost metagenome]